VSDFDKYRRRAIRMKRLEVVLDKAKDVFACVNLQKGSVIIQQALIELERAVRHVDQLPPPHQDDKEPS
jgi:hypothetical protein